MIAVPSPNSVIGKVFQQPRFTTEGRSRPEIRRADPGRAANGHAVRSGIRNLAGAEFIPSGSSNILFCIDNHWEQLNLFTTCGVIPIDNNDVEQLMRQVATGRKNWMFPGSADAGDRAATLLTLISTATSCGLRGPV